MSDSISNALLLIRYLKNLHLDEEKLIKIQESLIRKSVNYAFEKIEFYRNYWKNINFSYLKKDPFNLLKKIPSIKKETIIPNYNTIIGKNQFATNEQLFLRKTSGTYGRFSFLISKNTAISRFFIFLRSVFVNGYRPWQKIVDMNPVLEDSTLVYNYSGFFNVIVIPTSFPEGEQIKKLEKMNNFILLDEPLHLLSLTNSINETRRNIEIRPKFIVASGDILTRKTREIAEETFRCKVFESYSAAEFGTIAFECKNHNLHINSDSLILNLNKNGEILITNFDEVFPFIKYNIGDMGRLSNDNCNCGISFPCLEEIGGRAVDTIYVKENKISPKQIFQIMENFTDLTDFKLIKMRNKLKIITSDIKNVKEIRKSLNELFDKKLRIELKEDKKFKYTEGALKILQSY
jgi:phenylacetate-CoA ligase